ncbi:MULTISPECIES: 3'(2'),5'-bisphosphate nucleotidase CysQ family protein [Methylomonas]|uniref:Inositol-phosphate phosphatase n=1 Tax=Methylomonas koyamae TaxID=702114 RepID=A0A177N8Z0_9GAMM|nr:inositol monophosphatase family protein [Methylomonas koyamae]OAI13560.1 inositol-phosphate phosphatase [Methylomonas koyamae]
MQLSDLDLHLLGQCAILAAYQAGQLIARHAAREVAVNTKAGGASLAAQVVTEVDHLSQDAIMRVLLPTCAHYDLALLSEESPDDRTRLAKDYFWCIDPLDGTLPFIEGVPGYSVAIALVARDGTPAIGVVYDPLTQTLYSAVAGQGAWRNRQRLPARPSSPILTFVTDKSFADDPLYAATLPELERIAAELGYAKTELKLQGGAALNACLALQTPACYFKYPKPQVGGGSIWDYAATACLFREAGAPFSDMRGRPLALNPEGSTYLNHCGVLYCSDGGIAERVLALYRRLSG